MEGESASVPRKGYLLVIAAAILWAVSGTSGKYLFNDGMSPYHIVQIRVTLSSVLLFLFLLIKNPSLLRIARSDLFYFAVLGITGMAMLQFTYFYSISLISVAVAVLLQYLAPVFITIYYGFIAPERITRTVIAAVGISVLGCYFAVGAYNFDLLGLNWKGMSVALLSGLFYAWYAIYGERGMRRYDPWTVVFYAILFSAVFWNIATPPLEAFRTSYTGFQWVLILYVVVFGTAVPFSLYTMGISLIRSTRASVTATLEPIAAGFIAFFFLGESLEVLQMLGGLLVIVSVILLQTRREQDDSTSAIIRRNAALRD
ncbi:MAG: EamA family transporter [Desulfobacteraceae bacterium]|nr:EamA family transporter [Desulfobacteraceae bacterium]